jgi:pyruvate dehydrogenase (quinone)
MNELITVARYWRQWKDPRLVVLVLANRDLNMVTWEQRAMAGDPKLVASQELPPVGFAEFAKDLGLAGIRVDRPEDVGRAWDEALRSERPCVLEAITDPEVPFLPPHITADQARSFLRAILRGDPERGAMIRQAWRAAAASWFPAKE